jgi:hypothetical protein
MSQKQQGLEPEGGGPGVLFVCTDPPRPPQGRIRALSLFSDGKLMVETEQWQSKTPGWKQNTWELLDPGQTLLIWLP